MRHLPLRQGRADREGEGAASRARQASAPTATTRTPASTRDLSSRTLWPPVKPATPTRQIHKTQKVLHQPATRGQGFSVCHTPHGGEREHLLRAADTNNLCLTCHGPNAKGAKVADSSDISIFDGNVRLPENYLSQVFVLRLDDKGLGHPQERHPVGGVLDPTDPQKLRMMTCLTCHTPHGGGKNLLVPATDKSGSLCAQCHANLKPKFTPKPVPKTTNSKDKKKKKQQQQQQQ